jgi:hypothetical protein
MGNMPMQAIEIVEPTADKLPVLGDEQQGFGRVNFWKACLTAVNGGHLSSQPGRSVAGGCYPFTTLDVTDDSPDVCFYGLEIRTANTHPRATVWINRMEGNWSIRQIGEVPSFGPNPLPVQPPPAGIVTYVAVPKWSLLNVGANARPFVPWGFGDLLGDAEVAVCLTVGRSQLYFEASDPVPRLEVYAEGVDPTQGGAVPLISVPVDQLKNRVVDGLHVKSFSNYVFVIAE